MTDLVQTPLQWQCLERRLGYHEKINFVKCDTDLHLRVGNVLEGGGRIQNVFSERVRELTHLL